MQDVSKKAAVLIEALPYIQRFRNAVVVVKFGGSAMEDPAHVNGVLEDVAFMECVGMKVVVVHGGGKEISRGMVEAGIESRFVRGLRVTCERSIEVVRRVMRTDINPRIVRSLEEKGAPARSLHGEDIFTVRRMTDVDPATGETLDWGFVGDPNDVRTEPIQAMLAEGLIPVITPLGIGPDGAVHNINADVAAAAVAKALKARKLAFLSDVPGLLRDPKDPESLISTLQLGEVDGLIKQGIISGGMLPKIQSCVEALEAGVRKVHMIDGRMLHSLLMEMFTEKGVGTEIVAAGV
ncbi:MAG TPA: acetylglutamate kinase [Verrucomicrobia bacterium]|nr:acetylglutamate kinase [Verrucomicrobiota bacterium]